MLNPIKPLFVFYFDTSRNSYDAMYSKLKFRVLLPRWRNPISWMKQQVTWYTNFQYSCTQQDNVLSEAQWPGTACHAGPTRHPYRSQTVSTKPLGSGMECSTFLSSHVFLTVDVTQTFCGHFCHFRYLLTLYFEFWAGAQVILQNGYWIAQTHGAQFNLQIWFIESNLIARVT